MILPATDTFFFKGDDRADVIEITSAGGGFNIFLASSIKYWVTSMFLKAVITFVLEVTTIISVFSIFVIISLSITLAPF